MLSEEHRSREQYTSSWLSLDNSGNTSSCNLFPLHPINSSFTGQSVTTAASQIKLSRSWRKEGKPEGEDVQRRAVAKKTKTIKPNVWDGSTWKIRLFHIKKFKCVTVPCLWTVLNALRCLCGNNPLLSAVPGGGRTWRSLITRLRFRRGPLRRVRRSVSNLCQTSLFALGPNLAERVSDQNSRSALMLVRELAKQQEQHGLMLANTQTLANTRINQDFLEWIRPKCLLTLHVL